MAKGQQVAKIEQKQGALVGLDEFKDYAGSLGTDNIGAEDVTIPRLKLAQSMTKAVKDGMAGDGDFIHNITNEILLAKGEVGKLIPVCYAKEYLLWRDINDGGGIMARAQKVITGRDPDSGKPIVRYAWDKPNTEFTHKVGGKTKVTWKTAQFVDENGIGDWGSEIPGDPDSGIAATAHHNYVILLLPSRQMLAMSLARSSAKKAKDLNAMIKMVRAPIFARIFDFCSIPDKSDANDFFNWQFQPAGLVLPSADLHFFNQLKEFNLDLEKKGINVDFSDDEATDVGKSQPETGNQRF